MIEKENNKRPIFVSVVALYVVLQSLPKITGILFVTPVIKNTNPELYAQFQSYSLVLHYSPLVIAILLIISMVLFFLLKKSSLIVFGISFALEIGTTIWKILTPSWVEQFGTKGVNSLFSSLAISVVIFGYMLWLWSKEILK